MYGLTKGLIKLVRLKQWLAVFSVAAFISLSAIPAAAQTPTQAGDFISLTGNTVELAKGHTIRVHYDTGFGSRIAIRGTVKVFGGSSAALLQSQELANPTAGVYSIDINRDDLREDGEPGTGRLQLWIVVAINSRSANGRETEEPGVWVLRSTFELIENESGRTAANGGMWKTTNFLTTDGQMR